MEPTLQMPLTLRILFHGFRATLRAGLLLLVAWLLLIPSNANERQALGADPGTSYPDGLRSMRTAKFITWVAPPRAYELIARFAQSDDSPEEVETMLKNIATGRTEGDLTQEPFSAREIEGPRFIRVD